MAEMRILVVEDERTLASFIEQSLHAEGHAVTVCHDGPSGEAAALTGDYALVLLDLTLPGKDGLLARVRAQLRSPSQRESSVLEVAGVRMDLRTRRVQRDGRDVQLTAREFEVLEYLMRHPDQVLSREQLLNAVWGFDFDPGTKVLEVYIGYLRRKLGD